MIYSSVTANSITGGTSSDVTAVPYNLSNIEWTEE